MIPWLTNNFLRPRTSIELDRQSEEGKEGGRPEENDPDPGQGRKLQQQSRDKQPRSNLRSKLHYRDDVSSCLHGEMPRLEGPANPTAGVLLLPQ